MKFNANKTNSCLFSDSIAGKTEKRKESLAEANDEEILKLNKPLARIQVQIHHYFKLCTFMKIY